MEASTEVTQSIGEENDWCKFCTFSAMCLPQGHHAFVHSFRPELVVWGCDFASQGDLNALLKAMQQRIDGIVCQLGVVAVRRITLRKGPINFRQVQTASNIGELKAFIRGFARGVSEAVCDLHKGAEAVSTEQSVLQKVISTWRSLWSGVKERILRTVGQ